MVDTKKSSATALLVSGISFDYLFIIWKKLIYSFVDIQQKNLLFCLMLVEMCILGYICPSPIENLNPGVTGF